MNLRDLSLVIRDYKHIMTFATPADADNIDAEFWGSVYLPAHYPNANAIAGRARASILASAKEPKVDSTETDAGTKRSEASTTPKRTKS